MDETKIEEITEVETEVSPKEVDEEKPKKKKWSFWNSKVAMPVFMVACLLLQVELLGVTVHDKLENKVPAESSQIVITADEYIDYMNLKTTYGKAESIREFIADNYYTEYSDEDVSEYMLKGLVAGLGDLYSAYYSAEEFDQILSQMEGEYCGVGIIMQADESGYIKVGEVTHGSPAEEAGVQPGEYIMAVDDVEYVYKTMDLCASNVRGDEGTSVKITFLTKDGYVDRVITRRKIVTELVFADKIDEKTGRIKIDEFGLETGNDVKNAIEKFNEEGIENIVLDLRGCPGGLIESAVQIADFFLNESTIVTVKNGRGDVTPINTQDGTLFDGKLMVLIDRNSASAAEFLAAGLKDNERAIIAGEQSYGKGVMQYSSRFLDGSALKLTVYEYFSPNGDTIHHVGVTPDVEASSENDFNNAIKAFFYGD